MTCLELAAYAALFCFECFCGLGKNSHRPPPPKLHRNYDSSFEELLATAPSSPKIKHYNLYDELEACPRDIPKEIDWEVVEHDD